MTSSQLAVLESPSLRQTELKQTTLLATNTWLQEYQSRRASMSILIGVDMLYLLCVTLSLFHMALDRDCAALGDS